MRIYNQAIVIIAIASLLYCKQIYAQEISVYGQEFLWHADSLCDIELTDCDWRTPNQGYLLGYAYHPSGKLWLVLDEPINSDFERINVFDLKIKDCQYVFLYSILLPKNWSCSNAANIDFLGRLYLNVNEWDSISHKSTHTISRIADPAHPVIERVFKYFPNQQIFEIHFQNNRIFIPELDKPYIYIFDTNFILLDTIITQKHIWGLTSFSYGCDSTKTYATHMSISTQEYINTHPDTIMYISEYNLETNSLTPICNYNMGSIGVNTQLTSPLEFLSSDPECDLLLDLDRDNSTGVYPYDYYDSTQYCALLEAPICDQDLYLHTSSPLDSIQLTISSIEDPGYEMLISGSLPPGFSFIMRDDSTYVLRKFNGSDAEYKAALLAIRYMHSGQHRSVGIRHVIVQGFNAIKAGKKATCFVNVSSLPYAGIDASLILCQDTIIQKFSSLTQGQPGGYWWPSLSSGADQLNSMIDLFNQYAYIVSDPVCGTDTAFVHIVRDTSSHPDILGPDQKLCTGDSLTLSVNGMSIVWDDGSTSADRVIHAPGLYWLSSASGSGCHFEDSITILPAYTWPGIFLTTDPTCHQQNGIIVIDSSAFPGASQVIFNGNPTNAVKHRNLVAGIHTIKVITNDDCVSEYEVQLFDTPVIAVSMDTVITVPEDVWSNVSVEYLNAVRPVDIHFIPDGNIRWTNSQLQVFGDHDVIYQITFTDENGCEEIHRLHVLVEKSNGLYIPNVFRPESIVGNNEWQVIVYPPLQLDVARVYDRWGNMVYQSTDEINWDGNTKGKTCSSGVYVYQVILSDVNTGEKKTVYGDITLIR